MTLGTQVMFASLEVKGEATLASVSEREIPAWAAFNAWGREVKLLKLNDDTHYTKFWY